MDICYIKRNLLQWNKAKAYHVSMLLNAATIGKFKQLSTYVNRVQ